MRKFTKDQVVCNLEFPDEFGDQLQPLLYKLKSGDNSDLLFLDRKIVLKLLKLSDGVVDITNELWFHVSSFSFGAPHTIEKLDEDEIIYLKEVYQMFSQMFPLLLFRSSMINMRL